jgi:hypothetical protein
MGLQRPSGRHDLGKFGVGEANHINLPKAAGSSSAGCHALRRLFDSLSV